MKRILLLVALSFVGFLSFGQYLNSIETIEPYQSIFLAEHPRKGIWKVYSGCGEYAKLSISLQINDNRYNVNDYYAPTVSVDGLSINEYSISKTVIGEVFITIKADPSVEILHSKTFKIFVFHDPKIQDYSKYPLGRAVFDITLSKLETKVIDGIQLMNDGLELSNDTLYGCDFFPKKWDLERQVKIFSNDDSLVYQSSFNYSNPTFFINNDIYNNDEIDFDDLETNDKIKYQVGIYSFNCEFFNDVFQTQEITYVKRENIQNINTTINKEDLKLCPGEQNCIKNFSTFSWHNANGAVSTSPYYGRYSAKINDSDSVIITKPNAYIVAEERTSTQCPNVSRLYNFVKDDNCQAYLSGKIYGQYKNGAYPPLAGITVKTDKGDVAVSDANGFYEFYIDPANLPTRVYVADPDYYAANTSLYFDSSFPMSTDKTLYTYLLKNKDLAVHLNSSTNRPGFTIPYTVSVENRGKTSLKSKVEVNLDPSLSYTSLEGENAPASVLGQILLWDSVEVASGQSVMLKFYATLDANTSLLGTSLQNSASLKMSVVDDVLANNTVSYTPIVSGSYDPNDKLVTPQGAFTQGYVYDTTAFEYTIRFQNTGSDTAFTVRVQDVIDKDLDLTTINMIDASHKYRMTIKNDTVNWIFDNILLVDSTTNEPASHGFVRFFIKQKQANPQGTEITNLANIYFDFNEPIITNETVNIVDNFIVTSLEEKNAKAKGTLNVYPNPVTENLYIQLSEQGVFALYNQLGEKVFESEDLEKINLSQLSEGIYIYQVQTNSGNYTGKILKE